MYANALAQQRLTPAITNARAADRESTVVLLHRHRLRGMPARCNTVTPRLPRHPWLRSETVNQAIHHLMSRAPHRRFDLNILARQAAAMAAPRLHASRIEVVYALASDLPHANGNPFQLQQVILNLLQNSIDSLTSSHGCDKRVTLGTARDNNFVRFSISDTGGGILPRHRQRIFQPFFSMKQAGLGMGLAICRYIIASHGGELTCNDNHNSETEFCFTLPAKPTLPEVH